MKILAMKWRRLGDTVLWTSALTALRHHFPDAQIDLSLPAEYDALFKADPHFKTRYLLKSDPLSQKKLLEAWRGTDYDLVLVFHASHRTRFLARNVPAGERLIHHHSRRGRRFGSDRRVFGLGEPAPANERDANVVRTLGWSGTAPAPKIYLDPLWTAPWHSIWDPSHKKKRLVLSPGASRPAKRWAIENYCALVERLSAQTEIAIIAPQEPEWLSDAGQRQRLLRFATLCTTPDLEEAIGLIATADGFLGADSGLKHIAAALDIPTLTLFGPESVGEWHPYERKRHHAIQKAVSCRSQDAENPIYAWCGENICPLASHACLSMISVDEVEAAVNSHLSRSQ